MKSCSQNPSRGFNGERLRTVTPLNQKPKRLRRMSLALYPSDAATAAPSDSPALRPAQPAPTLVEGQGCCQDKEEANLSKLGLRPHHPRQGEPEDLLPDAEKRCVTTSPTTIQHFTVLGPRSCRLLGRDSCVPHMPQSYGFRESA